MDSSLEARLCAVEKELRHSRSINRVAGFAALFLLGSSLGRPLEDSLRLRRLEIVDAEGRPRIVAEANPDPQLFLKSETGQDQIRLAIGGQADRFRFDHKGVPHLALEAGQTSLRLSVSPAPQAEGLEEHVRVESAAFEMNSSRQIEGRLQQQILNVLVAPNKARLSIATYDPEDPGASLFDPGVKLYVDGEGDVTTKLGREEKK